MRDEKLLRARERATAAAAVVDLRALGWPRPHRAACALVLPPPVLTRPLRLCRTHARAAAIKTPPQSAADLKLIHGGKILDNTKTLADYHLASGADESGEPIVTTLHLWIRPAGAAPAKSAESQKGKAAEPKCACVVS